MAEVSLGSRTKRLAIVAGLLGLAIVAILVILSTSAAQIQLVGWAFGTLDTRFGIVARAEQMDLDLGRLEVSLRGLALASRGREDTPFFTVDEARIDLPWSALWDEVSVQAVSLVRPHLSFLVDPDGSSNLPVPNAEAGPTEPLTRLPIAALDVRDLTAEWRDDARNVGLDVGPTTATLSGKPLARGSLQLDGEA